MALKHLGWVGVEGGGRGDGGHDGDGDGEGKAGCSAGVFITNGEKMRNQARPRVAC